MLSRKDIVRIILVIISVFILFAIPWASVIGIKDPGILGATQQFQDTGAFLVLTGLVTTLIYKIYNKPLAQQMKEEEVKETDQKDTKQLLFKPTIGGYGLFLFFILLFVFFIIAISLKEHTVDFFTIVLIGPIPFLIWGWYTMPVFIFTEDSVHIKSHLLYLLDIDSKTVIRYEDITSVKPDAKIKGNMYGLDPRYRMLIITNETPQSYSLACYNSDVVAKIYLRFKEKLGDKVTLG